MKTIIISIFSVLITTFTYAQSITGLWIVDRVSVGDQVMTPVAKWFKFNSENTYQAGNGWLQNDQGVWKYTSGKTEFTTQSQIGADEFGAFKISFLNHQMYWERMENGEKVVVALSRIDSLPLSPKDKVIGNWELISNNDTLTPMNQINNKQQILIRWTGTYRKTSNESTRTSGYWYMHAHRPELRFISTDRAKDIEVFTVSFSAGILILKSKNDANLIFTYKRI